MQEDFVKEAAQSKQITTLGNKSNETRFQAFEYPLIRAKLQFFKCVAGQLQPSQASFQCDKPLVPFL